MISSMLREAYSAELSKISQPDRDHLRIWPGSELAHRPFGCLRLVMPKPCRD